MRVMYRKSPLYTNERIIVQKIPTPPKRCNCPCITNVFDRSYVTFCSGEPGHTGKHSTAISGEDGGKNAIFTWSYIGLSAGNHEGVVVGVKRCKKSVHLEPRQLPFLEPIVGNKWPRFSLSAVDSRASFYVCELAPGHDGYHQRSGILGALGISWCVSWGD